MKVTQEDCIHCTANTVDSPSPISYVCTSCYDVIYEEDEWEEAHNN